MRPVITEIKTTSTVKTKTTTDFRKNVKDVKTLDIKQNKKTSRSLLKKFPYTKTVLKTGTVKNILLFSPGHLSTFKMILKTKNNEQLQNRKRMLF